MREEESVIQWEYMNTSRVDSQLCARMCLEVTLSQFKHAQGYRPAFKAPVQMYQPAWHKGCVSSLRATKQRVKTISPLITRG